DHLQATAFPDQPLGRPILGTAKHVQSFTQGHLRDHIATHYSASSMAFISAGAVEHERMVALAEGAFAGLKPKTEIAPAAGAYGGGEHRTGQKLEQAHIALAFKG